MRYKKEKEEIIYWARKLNQRGFVTARSGNISLKVKDGLLITSHDCYLGELAAEDIVWLDKDGRGRRGERRASSEKALHLSVHARFPEAKVVIHAHSPYTVAFFHYFERLDIFSFEGRLYLGDIKVVPQDTPTVTQVEPVLQKLTEANIVVLGEHGVVSLGRDFKESFSLIELLEEQCRINLMLKSAAPPAAAAGDREKKAPSSGPRYKLLSPEHIERLKEIVNHNAEVQELGRRYGLSCSLAVRNLDTGESACFYYEAGKIVRVGRESEAEFVISGRGDILKKVFNRQLDPFVASTQGKVKTKGDFAKMSRWYPVLVKTFQLWEQAPVE